MYGGSQHPWKEANLPVLRIQSTSAVILLGDILFIVTTKNNIDMLFFIPILRVSKGQSLASLVFTRKGRPSKDRSVKHVSNVIEKETELKHVMENSIIVSIISRVIILERKLKQITSLCRTDLEHTRYHDRK